MHFISIEAQPQHEQQQQQQRSRTTATENPFAYRTSASDESDTSVCSSSSSSTSFHGATQWIKVVTFLLLGFGGGLMMHMQGGSSLSSLVSFPWSASASSQQYHQELHLQLQEQILQANDQIVQQLASENQQHQEELVRLKQELSDQQQQEHNSYLRSNPSPTPVVAPTEEAVEDTHALLRSADVRELRLEAAHAEATKLLRSRRLRQEEASP